ncbi:hypothetical protein B1207_03290 [Legionella quinlivanii]|uniref:Uncharacterized protein n=1 Tax=Legionella quinlivanii TaxID=45073 RepID=A0A364LMC3_9GAMM|nr:hypothetical protein [Legionella quinlivanii]RAP38027.1 hypothetical protein B1207_03290 [Legionella quinlivanii]
MAESSEITGLTRKLNKLIKQKNINGFPDHLTTELENTAKLLNLKDCAYNDSLKLLLIRLHLISIHVLKNADYLSDAEKNRIAKNVITCTRLITKSHANQDNIKYHQKLRRLLNSNAFEFRKYSSPLIHYPLVMIDSVVNAVNYGRSGIFRTDYPRSHFARKDYVSETLEHFTLVNRSASSRMVLSRLASCPNLTNSEDELISHLNEEVTEPFARFIAVNKANSKLTDEVRTLIASLNEIAKQLAGAEHNQVIHAAAKKAFLACQDLALEILNNKKVSLTKIRQLSVCFKQTALVIENPGNKEQVLKLSEMVEQSDYSRYRADREKTSYAVIHILVSAALLGLAIFEAVASHGLSMAVHAWIISAEGVSLGVGLGQLHYFSNSDQRKTLFFDSMEKMCSATNLSSSHQDWVDQNDLVNRRTELLDEIIAQKYKDTSDLSKEATHLMTALRALQQSSNSSRQELLKKQAQTVLSCAQDLALDLLRAEEPSMHRIQKLTECVNAAQKVTSQPENPQAIAHLVKLLNQGGYETTRVNKKDILIASLLALASIVLFAVTITGTILSGGTTAGTILSPFMLMIMSINRFIHAFQRQQTAFTAEARTLAEYSEIMGDAQPEPIRDELSSDSGGYSSDFSCA